MSDDSDSKPYPLPVPADRDGASASSSSVSSGASGCRPMAQMRWVGSYAQGRPDLGLPSEGSDSSGQDPALSPHNVRKTTRSRLSPEEDVEMKSSGSSGSGTESHGNESHGNESHGNDSNGHESMGSSNSRSKDSALLESSSSNKSSNSHSPSPPSSSNAYSLLSSEQDNPSTSGCSSQESAKAKNQKEVIKTLKELKLHVPTDKQHNSKSTTLSALKYALRCVKQVEANEEYYQLMMVNDSHPSGLDVSSYTIEEIDSITSEYTLKSNDIFAVAVSLSTGKIIYISDQAASILNCKRDAFKDSKFVEFLMPQDISVFYSFTTPYRLPSWSMCTGAVSDPSPSDCMQEKSFFCRISGGKEFEGNLRYYPFRMTPYLMKVQDVAHDEDQFCCLLLAERVHSGYEAPRIPPDKRIFTTTHTPNCVFQDVDERAVPLLGYLPQDLIGTPILCHLHPNDRPVMLAIHRKIIQYAGQPFDHSSIRFCAQNGEYIVLDTSWSTFVNPWSRKVSFVIGRHKVRMGPMNEDIFMTPLSSMGHMKNMDSDIQEITEQIHRLLLQPVHNSGSSGYSSLNSNEYLQGMTSSSSESLNNGKEGKVQQKEGEQSSKSRPKRTFQEICKGIHLQKNQEQQTAKSEHKRSNTSAVVRLKDSAPPISWREATAAADSRVSFHEELGLNDQTVYSYQQISCLDSVIRYLESYNVPVIMKRKCQSSSNTTSSNSDEDKQKKSHVVQVSEEPTLSKDHSRISALDDPHKKTSDPATAVVGTSMPLPVPNKPESVVSITSQCSYSSTIVHVGDKKQITEDVPVAGDMPESSQSINTPRPVSPPSQEMESYKKLGLTKQVLAAHTQKEEQAFLCRIQELRGLAPHKANSSSPLDQQQKLQISPDTLVSSNNVQCNHLPKQERQKPEPTPRRGTRNRKTKTKRAKLLTSPSAAPAPHKERPQQLPPPQTNKSHAQTPVSPSDASQPAFPAPYPVMLPGYPMQIYARTDSALSRTEAPPQDLGDNQGAQLPLLSPGAQFAPVTSHMVTPIMAFVLPNYLYPLIGHPAPPVPMYQVDAGGVPMQAPTFDQTAFPSHAAFASPPFVNSQNQLNPTLASYLPPPFYFPSSPDAPKPPAEGRSRSSTPQSGEGEGQASPPLFQSRCSSPLNLLELEFSVDRQDNAPHASVGQGSNAAEREKGASASKAKEREMKEQRSDEGNNSDVISTSSDMLDIILQEDSCSGTGSATSGSMGSGSNGFGTSASGMSKSRTSASGGSNNSSKYFGSVDSSQSSQKLLLRSSEERPAETGCVLQDPVWLLMANTDEKVMMTYKLPSRRDTGRVLEEDNEKIRVLQQCQPHFSVDQRKELCEVHPWIQKGELPKAINVEGCTWCDSTSETAATVGVEDQPDLGLGDMETGEHCCPERLRGEPLTSATISSHSSPPSSCNPRAEEANQQEF
uniref:Period circadian protein homolog 2 n=1 Tax=Poecilia formosa TaxID=48698 RepID=A0A096LVT3_POEFO